MYILIKVISLLSILFSLMLINKTSFAVTAEDSGPCSTGTNLFSTTATACRFTPQTYKASVYEMGLCSVNPMAGASLDKSTCTTVFTATDQTNGSEHDFALGDAVLAGVSTRPANGTYKFPYIILSNVFTIKAQFTKADNTTFYVHNDGGGGSCGTADTTSPAQECTSTLNQFAQNNVCDGEYLDAPVSIGTINGYLMQNSTLDKRDGAGETASNVCSNVDRLVGVINMDTPIVISPATISFKFIFNVTGYGAQMFTNTAPGNNPNGGGGSGPFSGFFEFKDATPQ
ncbi:MAG: hypothetical protein CMN42_04765 [SAR116 cluster bacterium]|jgi:hypothetical protein|nr:hypothetical protein [SAR116 cluster bacterium]|tara:strand:- start:360 stop:1217 length:858 start_codon:yes stop_codon:yes gene_type:complete